MLINELLLFADPALVTDMDPLLPPDPIPNNVVVIALPVSIQFLIALFDAPVASHTIAEDVPVFVLVMVMFRVAVVAGQTLLLTGLLEPSIVTYFALFSTNMAVLLLPLITGEIPDAGIIVSVFAALAFELLSIVMGKVSPG